MTLDNILSSLFRQEFGRMVAALTRLLGLQNVGLAEDIAQDTLLQAMTSWRYGRLPDHPEAWLHKVARNKAIDYLRRQQRFQRIGKEYARLLQSEYCLPGTVDHCFLDTEIEDSQLRMMFAACHPGLAVESQLAFVLKTIGGLSVDEIARAFLTSSDTIAKRIYRAREKFKSDNMELEIPQAGQLQERLDVVLKAIYLLFNEGYLSAHPSKAIREDLCREAMRLCLLLTKHPLTNQPRCGALMALLCFQASRLEARVDGRDQLILLQDQDRQKWYRPLIQKGFQYLEEAMASLEMSVYHLEAAIASIHAAAPNFDNTDWVRIYELYTHLNIKHPSPIVAMNKAIAAGFAVSPQQALKELQDITALEDHYLYQAALGHTWLLLGQKSMALQHFEKAVSLQPSPAELQLLNEKISHCR